MWAGTVAPARRHLRRLVMASRRKVVRPETSPRKLVKAEKNRRLVRAAMNHPRKLVRVEMKVRKPEIPRSLIQVVRAAQADRS